MQAMTRGILKMIEEHKIRYDGETNAEGKKHGKGKIIYLDGSMFDGNFVEDHKEGYGEYFTKEVTYKGEWQNGLKNGKGTLYFPNGDRVSTTFKNDKKHGNGIYITADGKIYDYVYYNDLQIKKADQNPDCY